VGSLAILVHLHAFSPVYLNLLLMLSYTGKSDTKERGSTTMGKFRYAIMQQGEQLEFVEMPATHTYQLTALNRRLHKEIAKLTANNIPALSRIVAECNDLELFEENQQIVNGLEYVNALEKAFVQIKENAYPLISLLTEIRALQAQLEQWYEEEYDTI